MLKESGSDLLKRAKAYIQEKNTKQALILLNDLIESGEGDCNTITEAYFCLATMAHNQGEIGKAIKSFKKVLELSPGHTDAALSLSVLYNDIGQYEDAKKIFQRTNERIKNSSFEGIEDEHVNKKFSIRHYELAELYMSYNRCDEALFEYNKAITLDKNNLEVHIKIAKVYAKKNFISKSFDQLRKLKNEHPEYMPARISLGVLYYSCGKVLEAQGEWQKVLARDPKNSQASMYLNLSQTASETSL